MIIHRAFIREVLQTCAAVTAILYSIFFVSRLVGFLSQAAEGDIPLDGIFLLLLLKMLTYLDIIVPLVLFLSVLLVMGRWIRDNELTVINACGIGMGEFIKPVLILSLIMGGAVGTFSLYLSPLSAEVGQSIEFKYRNRSDATGIIPGVFTEIRGGQGVYFVESYDNKTDTYQNIFVYEDGVEDDAVVISAVGYKTVDEKTNDDFLVLKNGSQYRGDAGDRSYEFVNFETYAIRLKQQAANNMKLAAKSMPTHTLLDDPTPRTIGEFHWRFSKIAMLPVLMIFALSFSSITYRKARFPGLITALLVYFTYSNVLGMMIAFIRKESVPPHLSMWFVNFLFLGIAIYTFRRRSQNKRLLPWLAAR